MTKTLITGAAGNLGTLLARALLNRPGHSLRLMTHHRDVPVDLKVAGRTEVLRADLADPATLRAAVEGVDQIIHFAGVLFKANPERFLPTTNSRYFRNLVTVARKYGVGKVVLISFPHVEGPTDFDHPARGRLDGQPVSVHAKTRLEEERCLFESIEQPVCLRVGMVYGRGILMIDAARWLASRRLLGVWKQPTAIHLISREDFCAGCAAALESPTANGIYHLGDEGKQTLQEFLNLACRQWGCPAPWSMPLPLIYTAASLCECYSRLTGAQAPLTRDFITIGRVPYYGDTTRFRNELLPHLCYRTVHDGVHTL
ncbi:MAG: NAD(P)H-binding protein [Verrucomicrobiota bacterium]|nr:NAD(P)H-binding protein [Verrucomicrobiota bacterium]